MRYDNAVTAGEIFGMMGRLLRWFHEERGNEKIMEKNLCHGSLAGFGAPPPPALKPWKVYTLLADAGAGEFGAK